MDFKLESKFKPAGDQPRAIEELTRGVFEDVKHQTLLGVTGSGKTYTMSAVIEKAQKPTLVISHNKTLAAQLASEFKEFFPKNAVHYFVSYYDYYQPEAYVPTTDTYIEKETQINEEIDRLRHAATQALLSRRDAIVVASVSCIYNIGSPAEYARVKLTLNRGESRPRQQILRQLNRMQFTRNDVDFKRDTYRVRGDVLEIYPSFSLNEIVRIEFFGDTIERISVCDELTGDVKEQVGSIDIYPASHYIAPEENRDIILDEIRAELKNRVKWFEEKQKPLEAERLAQRTNFDLDMIKETGFCHGIENYSRYFDNRKPGEPPFTLFDYYPDDFLLIIDESHITIPQIRGMYEGDRSRKQTLIDYGFRLPSALDNRPLKFHEFEERVNQGIYVSATPGLYEFGKSKGQIVEQLIRPTGLLDPTIEIRPTKNQIKDLVLEIKKRIAKKQRALVTTLTKRTAEELSDYLKEINIRAEYLHSEIETLNRLPILRDLRAGIYDVLVGINLLREGLDLPEVSLVAILDADKEGYLRSETSLIQVMGRAARHLEGYILMYADKMTGSMKRAIKETERRRKIQEEYNQKHSITPKSIEKAVKEEILFGIKLDKEKQKTIFDVPINKIPRGEMPHLLQNLENQMQLAAHNLEFEKAAMLRDQIAALKQLK